MPKNHQKGQSLGLVDVATKCLGQAKTFKPHNSRETLAYEYWKPYNTTNCEGIGIWNMSNKYLKGCALPIMIHELRMSFDVCRI